MEFESRSNMYKELRNRICSEYTNFYAQKGFQVIDNDSIRMYSDPSICFTTCTICHFKNDFYNQRISHDYCVVQPVLRTNTYNSIHSSSPLKYTAGITMLGTFEPLKSMSPSELFIRNLLLQAEFLSGFLLEDGSVQIKAPFSFRQILSEEAIEKLKIFRAKVEWSSDDFRWEYGHEQLSGQGTEWYIIRNGQSYEFGNVIAVYCDEHVIGVEAGGSVELLLQSLTNDEHKIFTNIYMSDRLCELIDDDEDDWIKLYDCVDVLYHIVRCLNTEKIFPTKLYGVLEKYMRALICLIHILGKSKEDMEMIFKEFEKCYNENKNIYKHETGSKEYKTFVQDLNTAMNDYWDFNLAQNDYRKNPSKSANYYSELEKRAFTLPK